MYYCWCLIEIFMTFTFGRSRNRAKWWSSQRAPNVNWKGTCIRLTVMNSIKNLRLPNKKCVSLGSRWKNYTDNSTRRLGAIFAWNARQCIVRMLTVPVRYDMRHATRSRENSRLRHTRICELRWNKSKRSRARIVVKIFFSTFLFRLLSY